MGLTARDWLTIALFVLSLVIGVATFLLRRFLQTVDKHQEALYGEQGIFRLLSAYVKREVHDVANAELAAQMEKLRLEGIQREGRILEAIEKTGERSTEENRIIRSDVRAMHERIDRVRDRRT